MNRKDTLRELLSPTTAPASAASPATDTAEPPKESTPSERTGAGAVRVMGISLQKLSQEAESGRTLRAQLAGGTIVVELEPELIEPSIVRDRLSKEDDEDFEDLLKSIESHGQQIPILVRPHGALPGRYQIVYGHRRLRAAVTLGQKIRAVVREMTDTEVVIAQGKENSERRDLSFIERALFARNLEEAGFGRATVMAALSVDRAEVTRLLNVARAIPAEVAHAIGPAPKAGRTRWMALAQLLEGRTSTAEKLIDDPSFRAANTDLRFAKLFAALSSLTTAKPAGSTWHDPHGRPVVKIERLKAKTRFTVDEKLAPRFGSYLSERLDELYTTFSADRGGQEAD